MAHGTKVPSGTLIERQAIGMQVNVKVLGALPAILGRNNIELHFATEPVTCRELQSRLVEEGTEYSRVLAACRLAVNHEFASPDQMIREQDEVALIGMVSGG